MLEEINAALKNEDYLTAQQLVNQLQQEEEDNPWLPLLRGRLMEPEGKLEEAKEIYHQLLRNTTNIKIISAARQALQNLEDNIQKQNIQETNIQETNIQETNIQETNIQEINIPEKPEEEVTLPKVQPYKKPPNQSEELGVLVLEPLEAEKKQAAAQQLAKIMGIDAYTARLQLPTRAWHLYRWGNLQELCSYRDSLKAADIPCFVADTADVEKISVYHVKYFESMLPEINLVCATQEEEEIKLNLQWSEIDQWVQATLPIFEEITDNTKGKIEKKTDTLDYSHICDLHLFKKNLILRLGDQHYEFKQGMTFLFGQTSARNKWNSILKFLETNLPEVPLWNDFNPFAEKALDFQELLKPINPHIHLFRREESLWDAAFHLYSTLAFLKNRES